MPVNVKLWNGQRTKKKCVRANSLQELITAGCAKLDIEQNGCCIVEESDGTEIDEWDIIVDQESKGAVFLLLEKGEQWTPQQVANKLKPDLSGSATTGADRQVNNQKRPPSAAVAPYSLSDRGSESEQEMSKERNLSISPLTENQTSIDPRSRPTQPARKPLTSVSRVVTRKPPATAVKPVTRTFILQSIREIDYTNRDSVVTVAKLISLSKLNECQWGELWGYDNFRTFVEYCVHENIGVQYIAVMSKNQECLSAIRDTDLARKLGQLQNAYTLPARFKNLIDFRDACRQIVADGEIPSNFTAVTTKSCAEVDTFRDEMSRANLLDKWCADDHTFSTEWSMGMIENALREIGKLQRCSDPPVPMPRSKMGKTGNSECEAEALQKQVTVIRPANPISVSRSVVVPDLRRDLGSRLSLESNDGDSVSIQPNNGNGKVSRNALQILLGGKKSPVSQARYYSISEILPAPSVSLSSGCVTKFVGKILPYVLQRVKMRGCRILQPSYVAELVKPETKRKADHSTSTTKQASPVSRLDCIACLLDSVSEIVASDLLAIMAQFPMALPLIIPRIQADDRNILTPLLARTIVKWESETIIENALFCDHFRMVVAVRLGSTPTGKSTILNQVFSTEHIFSSYSEPGSEFGRPVTLDGNVEFVFLTQETCKDLFWKNSIRQFYEKEPTTLCLLTNVHGNIIDHSDIVQVLNMFKCSFLAFLMPDCSPSALERFSKVVGAQSRITTIRVDPADYNEREDIRTAQIVSDSMLKKVRNIIKIALDAAETVRQFDPYSLRVHGIPNITLAKSIATAQSDALLRFVSENGCRATKQLMRLQTVCMDGKGKENYYQVNREHQRLIKLFTTVLLMCPDDAELGIIHLEKELSRMSNAESARARADVSKFKSDFQRKLAGASKPNKNEIEKLRKQIQETMEEVNSINLGLEHLFREIAQVYEITMKSKHRDTDLVKLPHHVADLFIRGHPIELMDGDAGDIAIPWFAALGSELEKRCPNMRIFVISIIGLQSSGKSTLLNSLFACRFAVSVGRCSRGLFMRLLVLDKTMSSTHDFDAILLIDTEGLGSPEKMNDPQADKKDRLLATFAMGISNLTIINVLGENMKKLVEILQIAVITMTRLEKADIAPDILLVQHLLTEKNQEKTSQGEEQFCNAIRTAIDLAEKKDMHVGVRSSKCLNAIFERIQNGSLLVQFHPYKHGSTVNSPPSELYHKDVIDLYMKILQSCKQSKAVVPFKKWFSLVENYWRWVSTEDFALHFKNVKEMYDFIERGQMISSAQEAIAAAFTHHQNIIKLEILEIAKDQNTANRRSDSVRQDIQDDVKRQLEDIPCGSSGCASCRKANDELCKLYNYVRDSAFDIETQTTIEKYNARLQESGVKRLMQIYDANIVQNGCCAQFEYVIRKRLQEFHQSGVIGRLSTLQQERYAEEIFAQLRDVAGKMESSWEPLKDRYCAELKRCYQPHQPGFNDLFKSKQIQFEAIFKEADAEHFLVRGVKKVVNAFKQDTLAKEIADLHHRIREIPEAIMRHKSADYFEIDMIFLVQTHVQETLQHSPSDISRNHDIKLRVHVWAHQMFFEHIQKVQCQWDKLNKPLAILEANRERYLQIIRTRLEHGTSCHSEAAIIAELMLKAILQRTSATLSNVRMEAVKDLIWLTNSEKVRLKYLSQLATEVAAGRKSRALLHFRDPGVEFQRWFKEQVDSYRNKAEEEQISRRTFGNEIKSVTVHIRDAETSDDIFSFVNQYLTQCEMLRYDPSDELATMVEINIEQFKETIINKLPTDTDVPPVDDFAVEMPSNNPDILRRVGCTARCFWCGALCWGHRGHEENEGDTKKHHSSHQPQGLVRTGYKCANTLVAQPCHERTDETQVYFGVYVESGITWEVAKKDHFSDWKFDAHYMVQFDDLMRWFMQELHNDIANNSKRLPATPSELQKHACAGLVLEDILVKVEQTIN